MTTVWTCFRRLYSRAVDEAKKKYLDNSSLTCYIVIVDYLNADNVRDVAHRASSQHLALPARQPVNLISCAGVAIVHRIPHTDKDLFWTRHYTACGRLS